ncbi:MAG TPA: hypothetical protein VGM43_20855 [Bryobacteraceae bacterium]|jgi:hypothetical protein
MKGNRGANDVAGPDKKLPPRDPEPEFDPTNPGYPRPRQDPDPDVVPQTDPVETPQI